MDTMETVAERNTSSNRGIVSENRKSNTNRNKVQKLMYTIVTVAERNSNRGMVREIRKYNTNREDDVQKLMDIIVTLAERNRNRGVVRKTESPIQIGNIMSKI